MGGGAREETSVLGSGRLQAVQGYPTRWNVLHQGQILDFLSPTQLLILVFFVGGNLVLRESMDRHASDVRSDRKEDQFPGH